MLIFVAKCSFRPETKMKLAFQIIQLEVPDTEEFDSLLRLKYTGILNNEFNRTQNFIYSDKKII